MSSWRLCMFLDDSSLGCQAFLTSDFQVKNAGTGEHRLHVMMYDNNDALLSRSDPVHLRVVPEADRKSTAMREYEDLSDTAGNSTVKELKARYDALHESLIQWSQRHAAPGIWKASSESDDTKNYSLVVGVKSSVTHGFPYRQAIRETWGHETNRLKDIKIVFLGCQPEMLSSGNNTTHMGQVLRKAVQLEKAIYGDLLTDELKCIDVYEELVEKVSAFFEYASQHWTFQHVMIADDDIYLRVQDLATDLQEKTYHRRFYAGELPKKIPVTPERHPQSRYYVDKSTFPMNEYPTFAHGCHYLLSSDCVHFIGKNQKMLKGVSWLDDVSVALWLFSIQVQPKHIPRFRHLRTLSCRDDLVSLADLSPLGIRSIHANIVRNRTFCHKISYSGWKKHCILSRAEGEWVI